MHGCRPGAPRRAKQKAADDRTTSLMSKDLRQQFELLQNDISTLVHHFEYEALFARSEERIDLLNAMAPVFFRMVCDVLWADLLAQVPCITGPARTAMRCSADQNLSLRGLPPRVHPSIPAESPSREADPRILCNLAPVN